jgi:uncharacterized delta-60 repeat protein
LKAARLALAAAAALVCACLPALFPAPAAAAPADLDRGFGGDGIVPLEWPGGGAFASESSVRMAVGPEDEVIVLASNYACAWQFECPTELALTRYDAAGNLDSSFGSGPASRLRVQQGPERHPFDLAVGPDGKAVVAAYDSGGEEGALRVMRFDRSGNPDPAFGVGGETTQPLRPGWSAPVSVAVQPDDKVVLATEGSRVDGGQELRLARYLANGALDTSFGGSGEVRVTLPTQTRPGGLLLDPTGGITVASPYCCVGGSALFGDGFSVTRVLGDGTPDAGFAGSGRLLFPTPGAEGTVTAISLAPGGGTFVLFEERTETVSTVGNLVKLAPNGSSDGSFGNAGRLRVFDRVGSIDPTAIVVDGKGRIVGAGADEKVAAFRLRPDGSVDRTFNGGQHLVVPYGNRASAVALQSSGRIVVLGASGCCSGPRGFALIGLRGGADRSRCQGKKATIVGTRRRDELTGTSHRDVIAALGGNDEVRALAGPDLVCGGKGKDRLLGGAGKDLVKP